MDPAFWHQRWQEGRIGFHQSAPTPLLVAHWPALGLPAGTRVFVPLAGKSLDMAWLASQGHEVLGIELSALAVQQFFDEHGLQPAVHDSRYGRHYVAGGVELICGDVFALDADALAGCGGVFDRAALIALPQPLRQRYAHEPYAHLPTGCRGLLVTLDYPPHEKVGPPFAVTDEEVHALFEGDWRVDRLERRDILAQQPAFVAEGVTELRSSAFRLERR